MGKTNPYSVPGSAATNLHKITYGGSRLIEASTVAAMLDGDDDARRQVDEAVLTRKAIDWRYEHDLCHCPGAPWKSKISSSLSLMKHEAAAKWRRCRATPEGAAGTSFASHRASTICARPS